MENKGLIYYVEDDENIRELAIYALAMSGYDAQGFPCARDFYEACAHAAPDLILLDIMLPEVSGLQILEQIRSDSALEHIPVMMLTAKDTEYDTVLGLDSGADDYLAKPFGMMELVSRVNALLRLTRRSSNAAPAEDNGSVLHVGLIELDRERHAVRAGGTPVRLTVKEFDLLRTLLEYEGKVLTRAQLLDIVWDMPDFGETRTVDVHVMSLRQKLSAAHPSAGAAIRTIRGVGYVFRPEA